MRLLLDTNRLSDFFRGDPTTIRMLELAEEVRLPFIVMAEIKAGFVGGTRPSENEALLNTFLRMSGVAIYPDSETTDIYAGLFAQLKRAGTPIPTNDLWIASLAVQHQLTLFSRDRHFERLPQISRA